MKFKLIIFFFSFFLFSAFSQDLPQNPEPGKCYVRCTTPDIYVNENVKVMVRPSYKKIKIIPAEFEKRTERVIVKQESKRLKVIPAKWGKETVKYIKKEGASTVRVIPAEFSSDEETIEVKPKFAQWEMESNYDCESSNPDD